MQRNLMCECYFLNCNTELLQTFKDEVCNLLVISISKWNCKNNDCFLTSFPNTPPTGQIAMSQTYIIG